MTHQAQLLEHDRRPDAAGHVAQLRQVLALVEQIAGRPAPAVDTALDEAARVGAAYADALPVTRRRFDALTAETVAWAAAGVEALTRAGGSRAAASRLADELRETIESLLKLLKL